MIKTLLLCMGLIGASVTAFAEPPHGLNQGHMEMIQKLQNMSPAERAAFATQMQSGAAKSQECFNHIDQMKIQALQIRGDKLNQQITALCAQGKESEAEALAMREGKAMMNDPTVKKMQECSKDSLKHLDFLYGANPASEEQGSICSQ